MSSSATQARLPWLVALAAGLTGAVVGWLLVERDVRVWAAGGFTAGPELEFVVFLIALSVALGYFVTRRILVGPKLSRDEWSVYFPTEDERVEARLVSLVERLTRLGYQPDVSLVDQDGRAGAPASPAIELAGAQLYLREQRASGRNAHLVLRIAPSLPGQRGGMGIVEVHDGPSGLYDEMGRFLIIALGELLPGLTFHRSSSTLTPEPAESMRLVLSDAPDKLPR